MLCGRVRERREAMGLRLAFLADIHGNLPALEAVVEDLRVVAPDAVYLVGDQINRCPWNNEVMDLVADRGWPAIQGNHEIVVGAVASDVVPPIFLNRARFPDAWWTVETLAPVHLESMRRLPAEMRVESAVLPTIRLFHGVPGDPFIGLLPESMDDALVQILAPVEETVVVCAHTHRPMWRRAGRWEVFNGGSVGMPYNRDPRSQYLVLTEGAGQWRPDFRKVDYDRTRVRDGFVAFGLFDAYGPWAALHLGVVETGEPWVSDFAYWIKYQSLELQHDIARAVVIYSQHYGPGRWYFGQA
jgi:predicted phosphodiesterase